MQSRPYGAHEVMELHEVLNCEVDALNTLQLYAPYVRDPELAQILGHQLQFMQNEYNSLVHTVHGLGAGESIPYRPRTQAVQAQAVVPPAPGVSQPNAHLGQMDDRDVSSALLGIQKTGAKTKMAAALEASHPQIRDLLLQSAVNSAHQAYEVWGYMYRKGYYTLAVMQDAVNAQLLKGYQPLQQPPQSETQPVPEVKPADSGSISAQLATGTVPGGATPPPTAPPLTPVNASHIFSSPAYKQEHYGTIEDTSMTADELQGHGLEETGALSQQGEVRQPRTRKKSTSADGIIGS